MAVLANVAYRTAYVADIFAQIAGYHELWREYRWMLFLIGMPFAGIITRFVAMGMFQSHTH